MNRTSSVENRTALTRPDKVLFPKDGITKGDLVEYYQNIAPAMLPYLEGRPIAMQRFPDGISSQGFFQKNAGPYFPDWIKTVTLRKQNGTVRHIICNDAATLIYLANQAVITPHIWLSRADRPGHPDSMAFDLDPPKPDQFKTVCAAALALRELLQARRLESFVKTTGSRGLHVVVPLDRSADFDAVRAFAQNLAEELVQSDPDKLTTEARKNKRGGRIFVDTARNAYAQTVVAPYAVRARDGAPVAAPLRWEEVESPKLKADQFNIHNIFERLRKIGNPWKDLNRHARKLPL